MLFKAAGKTDTPMRDTALIALLLDTGCRASELCGLTLRDVTFRARHVEWSTDRDRRGGGARATGAGRLRIHARTHHRPIHSSLPGYEVRATRDSLRAEISGPHRAHLEIATPSEIRITV